MSHSHQTTFIELYNPVHQQFCRFCRALAGNQADSEDLIQDTLLTVLESFDKIKDKAAFKSYLFSVASNLNKMKRRRLKFKAELNEDEIRHLSDLAQNQEYLTDFKIVYQKIMSLPAKTAEALVLFHISDLSLEEIQKIQGDSLSAVKSRVTRGREKLLALLNTPTQVKVAVMFFNL